MAASGICGPQQQENTTTRLLPNQILLGHKATLIPQDETILTNNMAQEITKQLLKHRAQAIKAIRRLADAKGVIPSQYQEGNQVWLEGTHLKL